MKTIKALFGILTLTLSLLSQVQAQAQSTNLVTTLTMTFEQAQNLTTPVLPFGGSYFFLVTGRYGVGPGDRGEAMGDAAWGTVTTSTLDQYHNPSCGWQWNGTCTNRPTPDVYQTNHVYRYNFTGRGGAEVLTFTDSVYGDNVGTLTFELYEIAQSSLTTGLVAYYPFKGDANDATAYHNNPILNTATLSTNRFGEAPSAYDFGPSKYISCNNAPQLAFGPQTSFGVFTWIKFSGYVSGFQGIVSKMMNDTNQSSGFQIGISQNMLQAQIGSPPAVIFQGTTVLNDGRWHAVGLVLERTSSTARLFVDGNLDGTVTDSKLLENLSCTDSLLFGVERNYSRYFPGTIDDVRIYNRALSPTEVQQLYVYESGPRVDLIKIVQPSFSNLSLGTNYQLQVSGNLNNWTNQGSAFTATNTVMVYPQYWDVDNWNSLFFRLQVAP